LKLSELEFRALEILESEPRIPLIRLAKLLGVNRNTASRMLKTLMNRKDLKFHLVVEGLPTVFAVATSCGACDQCYPLVDGKVMCVTRDSTVDRALERIPPGSSPVFVSQRGVKGGRTVVQRLTCDYCGKEVIQGESYLTYSVGRRKYYLCCESCLVNLKRRLGRVGRNAP